MQFHPAYTYEDFFEGIRPRLGDDGAGGLRYELVPGPLRRLAESARAAPTVPHILVIDEMNRANLAKVFGELYFLLEYRDVGVRLQYSGGGEPFMLPPNLFVIGTMNTADRSIALVDAAIRRRFYFVPFFPDEPPVRGLLDRWLSIHGLGDRPARLLDALNERISDRDTQIGPSFLMVEGIDRDDELDRVWRHAILPLLTEQHTLTGVDITDRFGLRALRRQLDGDEHDPSHA